MAEKKKIGRPKKNKPVVVEDKNLKQVLLDKIHELDSRYQLRTLSHDGYAFQIEEFVKNLKIEKVIKQLNPEKTDHSMDDLFRECNEILQLTNDI